MQSTFKHTRKTIIIKLFENSQTIYTKWFKKNNIPWNISKSEFLKYPKNTLGYAVGDFLTKNNFEILPKLERHDCYHIITEYGTEVQDEIALQYMCFGNGKKSIYLIGVIIVGTILLPDYFKYYIKSFKKGKQMKPFYNLDFKSLLNKDLTLIKKSIT